MIKEAIQLFDQFLAKRGISFEAIIIGGAALNVMDVINRLTKDVDFLDPKIPDDIKQLSIEFAKLHPELNLAPMYWINNGPQSLVRDLPQGWRNDLQKIFVGDALILWTLGRLDLLRSKLYACADREIDYNDCLAMKPSAKELVMCKEWVLQGDGSHLWPGRVEDVFARLKKDLGHE